MKIHLKPKDFLPKFRLAASVASGKDFGNALLQNVKIIADKKSGVVLQATDTEVGIRISIACDVAKNGEAILPKERLLKVLDLTREESLTLEFVEDKIVIEGNETEHYALDTMLPEEFPEIGTFGATAFHEIPAKELQETIRRTIFAIDSENVKYALGGVSFEMTGQVISIVATDGRRLAWQDCGGDCINNHTVETVIVPARTLQLLHKALCDKFIGDDADVKMAVANGMVWFQCHDITLFSRLIEGRFPKWRGIIPKTEGDIPVKIDCDPLLSAILQAEVTTSDLEPGVDFSFEKGKLTLQGQGKERGNTKIEIPLSFNGNPKKIKLDPKFMTDFLRVLDAKQKVSIYLPPDDDPVKITADDGGYVYVVMPMAAEKEKKSEAGYQTPEVESPEPETESPEAEVESPEPEVENPESEIENPAPEVRNPEPKVRSRKPKVKNQEPEVRSQMSGIRSRTSGARIQKSGAGIQESGVKS